MTPVGNADPGGAEFSRAARLRTPAVTMAGIMAR